VAYFDCMHTITNLKNRLQKSVGRKKRDREGSTQALLMAGVEVFSAVGYDAATTRAVAKKAGVSEALIQRYFEGKAGLLVAILESFGSQEVEAALGALPYRAALHEEILQLLKHSCEHMALHRDFIRVALSRAIIDPKVGKQLAANVHGKRLPAVVARLHSYRDKGMIHADADIGAIAFAVSSLGFSLGFMGPTVFGMPTERLEGYAHYFATLLATGAQVPKLP